MALFSGVYNLSLSGLASDTFHGQNINFQPSFRLNQNLPITEDTTLDFALPIYELTGVVTDADGNPIPNVGWSYSPLDLLVWLLEVLPPQLNPASRRL